jgi:hypothetical protein
MKNFEIIQYIDRFCVCGEDLDTCNNADLAYTILAHGYLYVRPGKPTEKFVLKIIEALKMGANDGFDNYLGGECNSWPLDECIRCSMASSALQVARKSFDKRYFEKQISLLDFDEEFDDTLIDKYLNLMSKEQFGEFILDLSYCRANYLAFTTIEKEVETMDGLHDRCREINSMLPKTTSGYEYLAFRTNNPYYLFDYLSTEEIISAVKNEILWNKSLAGHMARWIYNTNSVIDMDPYIKLISTYERTFGGDIYEPHIFYEPLI